MKLKSKRPQTLVLSFIEGRAKKTKSLKPHEILELDDSVQFLSKKAFNNEWIEILNETETLPTLPEEDKMTKAKREAEEYIRQTLTNK